MQHKHGQTRSLGMAHNDLGFQGAQANATNFSAFAALHGSACRRLDVPEEGEGSLLSTTLPGLHEEQRLEREQRLSTEHLWRQIIKA